MPRTTCSDAGKNLAACRWRKHNKKKAKARIQRWCNLRTKTTVLTEFDSIDRSAVQAVSL